VNPARIMIIIILISKDIYICNANYSWTYFMDHISNHAY